MVPERLPPVAVGHAKFLKPWADKVAAESNGRIKIDIFPSMQLGGTPPQLFDQARDGVADLVWTLPGYTPGRFTGLEAFELPFVANKRALVNSLDAESIVEYSLAENGGAGPGAEALEALPGVHAVQRVNEMVSLAVSSTSAALPALLDLLKQEGCVLADLHTHRPTLEDVFLHGLVAPTA